MAEKKDACKYTVRFNSAMLTHVKAMKILDQTPARGKASLIAEALAFYNDALKIYDIGEVGVLANERPVSGIKIREEQQVPIYKKAENERRAVVEQHLSNNAKPHKNSTEVVNMPISLYNDERHDVEPEDKSISLDLTTEDNYDQDFDEFDAAIAESLINGFNL